MKEEELRCILKLEEENSELVKKVKTGVKRLLNQNDQKDKEIERLNNIIDELHILFIEFDKNVMRRKYGDANMINLEIKAKLRELKGSDKDEKNINE